MRIQPSRTCGRHSAAHAGSDATHSSAAFKQTSLHATVVEAGISRMRPVNQLRIEAGRTAEFKPGGMHLMLMTPTRPLRAGDKVKITFDLEDGRKITGNFDVRGM